MMFFLLVLFGITRVNWRTLSSRCSLRPALAAGILLVAGVWLWNFALTAPDGKTHVLFLDSDGAATPVRTPGGNGAVRFASETSKQIRSRPADSKFSRQLSQAPGHIPPQV